MITSPITVSAQKAVKLDCDEMLIWGCVGKQTMVSGASDPVYFYFKLDTETYGTGLIKKTSEDGVVSGIKFNISGNSVNQTVVTKADGTVDISLMPGVYTVTEQPIDRYEPQSVQRITIVSGHTSTVTFSNTLKRGSLEIIKNSEDNLVEGVKFHLYGTSLSGLPVDEYAVTDANGVARFENVLISGADPYTVEEIDTAVRYVTLTKRGEYEIVAVFKTVAYSSAGFRYYDFVDTEDENAFNAYIAKCKELALYDTGVTAEYGDRLITLSTCEYSAQNGRLVVVAKKVA